MTDVDMERLALLAAPRVINWNPYLVGAGIGILSWIVFVVVAAPISFTGAVAQLAEDPRFRLDYGTLFLAGTLLGAFASSLATRTFRIETVPAVWRERFGASVPRRMAAAFVGGALVMYGARMAGGCTSGNGLSQGLQLAVVGWTFLAVMFPVGVLTAWSLFGLRAPR